LGEDLVRHRDRLFSTDKTRILIIAHPRHPSTDSYHAAALIALIDRLKAETVRASAGRVRVADLAGHRFSLENASRVKRDILKTVGISTIGVVVLTALSFANPLFVPLALLPAAFGACFALGLIRWLSPNVSAISIGCGSMLIGIAVDYGIHILYHADHAGTGRGKAGGTRKTGAARLLEILPRLTRPLLLSAGTTVLAFLALRFSILPGYRDLGLFAALGIGGAAVFALTALPPLVPILKSVLPGRGRPILPLGYWFLLFMRRTRQKRLAPTLILAALTLVALAGWPRLRIEGDYQKMNALEPETRRDWDRILEFFGGGLRVSPIAVRGASLEEALEENERLYQALVKLKEEGVVAEFQSIAPILPSQRSQGQNAARWAAFWSTERIEALRDALAKAGEGMGMRPEAFQPFFDSLPGSLERVGPEDLKQAGLARLIETHLSVGEENTLVLTHARTDDPAAFARLVERLRPDFPGLLAANGQVFMGYMARLIFGELRRMALIAFILVAGLLLVSMRSPRSVLVMLLPLALSAFWTFGFMGWLGVSINLMNSIVTIFIMGLVVDYSIFLYHAWEGHGAASHSGRLASSGAAVAISAMTTLAGFGALALASHPVLHSIGFTALLGISTGWLAVTLAFPLLGKRG
jgi:predicted exporter